MLVADSAHKSSRWWELLVDEDENGLIRLRVSGHLISNSATHLLWRQLDSLSDNVHELTNGEVL